MPCPRTQRHLARPGIEPVTFWLLARFPNCSAIWPLYTVCVCAHACRWVYWRLYAHTHTLLSTSTGVHAGWVRGENSWWLLGCLGSHAFISNKSWFRDDQATVGTILSSHLLCSEPRWDLLKIFGWKIMMLDWRLSSVGLSEAVYSHCLVLLVGEEPVLCPPIEQSG